MASTNPRNGLCSEGQGATVVEGADHGHPYFWCEPTLSLIEQFFKKYMK